MTTLHALAAKWEAAEFQDTTFRDCAAELRAALARGGWREIPLAPWTVGDTTGAEAACKAIRSCEIGPGEGEDDMLTIYDLIPDVWCAPDRTTEVTRVCEHLAWAAISAWLTAHRDRPEPPR